MAEVTVLVAVYNAVGYLPRCLDSLLGQSLKAIQIICIDDGSTVVRHMPATWGCSRPGETLSVWSMLTTGFHPMLWS